MGSYYACRFDSIFKNTNKHLNPSYMKSILYTFILLLSGSYFQELSAATKTWTGSVNNSWNESNNWQPAGVPTANDDVFFNGEVSSINCQLSTNKSAKSITIESNYTGTLFGADNPSRILTVIGGVNLNGGTLNMNRSRLKVSGNFIVNGGTFVKGNTGILSLKNYSQNGGLAQIGNASTAISGDFNLSNGSITIGTSNFSVTGNYSQSGGTFSKSGGFLYLSSLNIVSISAGNFNCNNTAASFGTFNQTGGTFDGGTNSIYFTNNASLLNATFTKSAGFIYNNNNTLSLTNTIFTLTSPVVNLKNLTADGSTLQLGSGAMFVETNTTFNNSTINKPSGDARYSVGSTFQLNNSTFTHGNGLLNIGVVNATQSDLNIGNGTFNAASGFNLSDSSSLTKSGGFVYLAADGGALLQNSTINFSTCASVTAGNLTVDGGQIQFGTCPLYLNGTLELNNDAVFNAPSSFLELKGNFRSISGTFNHQLGTIRFVGSSTVTYSVLGFPTFYKMEIQNLSGIDNKKIEIFGNILVENILTFNNGSAASRAILIENGFVQLGNNFNVTNYRTSQTASGNGFLRFIGGSSQTIVGLPASESICVLPKIEIDKNGGVFAMNGIYNFGNGLNVFDSNIDISENSVICLLGGEFNFGALLIPTVKVLGTADLRSNLLVLNNFEITPNGLLNNLDNLVNVAGTFLNEGSFLNYNGTFNASGSFVNRGAFSANLGAVNALQGIQQESGIFACNQGQVNIIGTLLISGGTFSGNSGMVAINGSISQTGGTLNGNLGVGNISITQDYIQDAGLFDAQSGSLNIGRTLTLNGLFFRNEGTINFNGIGPQTIPTLFYNKLNIAGTGRLITMQSGEIKIGAEVDGFTPNTSNSYITTNNTINFARSGNQQVPGFAYNNLTVSRSGQKTMLGNASLKKTLTVNNSAILDADGANNNKVFTLLSNQSQTASIAPILQGGSIIGNVTAQRWIRGGIRSNRFLGSPVDTTNGITFRQIKDNVLCFSSGGVGFDVPTVFTSNLNTYEESRANGTEWTRPTNISNVIPKGKGLIVFHLGDRSQAPIQNGTVPNAAVIDFKGVPNQGNVSLPIACTGGCSEIDNGNGWALLANPYASPIDWDSPEWIRSGVSSTIFIWNPRINQYASYTSGNPGIATNGGSRYIGPGQSFFLRSTSDNPVLTTTEGIKATQFPDTLLFKLEAPIEQLSLIIENTELEIQDETLIGFDAAAKEEYEEGKDVYKVDFPGAELKMAALNVNGDKLSVHTFNSDGISKAGKRIPLSIEGENGIYAISAKQLESFSSDYTFYLEDAFTQKIYKLVNNNSIEIELSDNKQSKGNARFSILINKNSTHSSGLQHARIYPNPGNGSNFKVVLDAEDQGNLTITDLFGNVVHSQTVSSKQALVQMQSLSHLAKGMYAVIWQGQKTMFNERLTIQ